MGAVGINFGAVTSGAGFDVTTTVASIVSNLKAVETPWTNQLTSLKAEDTAFTSIGTDLNTLSSSLQALTDFQGVMASKLGSSSDTSILSLGVAGATAVAGSHTVVVSQLAQSSSAYTGAVPASDVLGGALTIRIGSGPATTIPVVSGKSDTLATYAAAINLAGIGVSASVISDTTGSRLELVSQTSGLAGQLTVTSGGTVPATTSDGVTTPATTCSALSDTSASSGTALSLTSGLDGQDAMLTVDGLYVDSATNTITTAIPGVSFQLLSSDPSANVQVQIANNNSGVESAFSSLVTAYNAVIKDIKTQEGNDSSGNSEPLFGNTVISQLQSALSLSLSGGTASGSIKSLDQLGISVNQDGTLTLNESALDARLTSSYTDVVGFMQNTGGFGQNLLATLDQMGSASPTGAITLALAANSSEETVFNDNVTAQDALIATQKTNLTSELNTANQVLQAIPQQLNEMNELYSAMTGYNRGTTG